MMLMSCMIGCIDRCGTHQGAEAAYRGRMALVVDLRLRSASFHVFHCSLAPTRSFHPRSKDIPGGGAPPKAPSGGGGPNPGGPNPGGPAPGAPIPGPI